MKQNETPRAIDLVHRAVGYSLLLAVIWLPDAVHAQIPAYGFVWANESGSASYTPDAFYSYNAGGGDVSIVRNSVGDYWVTFDGLSGVGANGGHVQVTAYGGGNDHCKVIGWSDQGVGVTCFDTAGNPVDTRYTMLYWKPEADTDGVAYAWANEPGSASYTPDAFYSYNAGGGDVSIVRNSVGDYMVTFDGLSGVGVNGGHVQVTAYGGGNARCKVTSWGDQEVDVACFDPAGNSVDTRYTVLYWKPEADTDGVAYAWANEPGSASYTPDAFYSYNAGGGDVSIVRNSVGDYMVTFDGLSGVGVNGGHVQVTAYGGSNARCKVIGWGDQVVGVACFDTAGNPIDTHYTVLFLKPTIIGTAIEEEDVPEATSLIRHFPNPVSARATIIYHVDETAPVRIAIYDVLGRRIRLLLDEMIPPGTHQVMLDTAGLPSGLYLYGMSTAKGMVMRTMVVTHYY
ncbi:MAG: T9SS type A sorting domain-containing protein [Rhodothermales bacterium]